MALRMAQPWTHPTSKTYYLRQRTPTDLLNHVLGQTVSLPVGGKLQVIAISKVVQVSLKTKDAREARDRHAQADAALQRFWQRKRAEVALAEAARSTIRLDEPPPTMSWNVAVERFGASAATTLADEGVPDTDANRAAVIAEVAGVFDEVAAMMTRTRGATYAAGLISARPAPGGAAAEAAEAGNPRGPRPIETALRVTVAELWDRFCAYKHDKITPNTIRRYAPCVMSLAAHCGDRGIRDITSDDIFAWAELRRDRDGVQASGINRVDLAAIKSAFGWAVTRQGGKLLSANPAAGIRLDEPRRSREREATFREAEVQAILSAALDVKNSNANPADARAKRWCPWLAAYSGARISELTALTAEDIRQEQGVWVMDIRKSKTGLPRMVPLHAHLIEQGFIRMRNEVGSGPLFYDPARHTQVNPVQTPAELRSAKLARWVRNVVPLDPVLQPNHAWRHSFKSRCLDLIDMRIRDYIVGHVASAVPRKYEHPPVPTLAAAMARYPRYEVPGAG